MDPADAAAKLRALATRVRHNLPRAGDPERFHVELSDIAGKMMQLAGTIEADGGAERPDGPTSAPQPAKPTAAGRVTLVSHTEVICGRRVTVQRRRLPFAIQARD